MQLNPGKSYVSCGADRAPRFRRNAAPTSSSCSVVIPGATAERISRSAWATSCRGAHAGEVDVDLMVIELVRLLVTGC